MRGLPSSLPSYGIWIVLGSAVVVLLVWFAVGAVRRRRTPAPTASSAPPPAPVPQTDGPVEQLAGRATAAAQARLVGQRYAGLQITSVLHYGAVDLGTQHLVVWVLVSGPRSEEVPGWWAPGSTTQQPLPAGWEGWLTSVRDAVREELAAVGWPQAETATVLVDSEERVRRTGFDYFR